MVQPGIHAKRAGGLLKLLVVLLTLAVTAAACGGDDNAGGSATTAGTPGSDEEPADDANDGEPPEATSTVPGAVDDVAVSTTVADDAGEPVVGGEVTILQLGEVASLDPHTLTTSGGAGGQRIFPFYGALMTYVAATQEVVMIMAESFVPNDDFSAWTLTVRDGITFSDGTPYDAAAVKLNWERIANPETRSPNITAALSVASMEVVDDLTLVATLVAPNAHFDKVVSGASLNFIASAKAITDGADLGSQPIGAGPYLLESWQRDDRMVLARNPDYFDAPRPYLDKITYRIVIDDTQRVDTFATDESVYASWHFGEPQLSDAADGRDGSYVGVLTAGSPAFTFNNTAPPFDDPRVRRAVIMAVDREALVRSQYGDEAVAATNFAAPDSPWFTEAGNLPEYDPEAAQALFNEIAAETGAPVSMTLFGFQNAPLITQFVQTSLDQYENVEVELVVYDSPTGIGRVIQGDYQMSSWGYPFLDPDPGLYRFAHSQQSTNFSHYSNAEVDALLDEARLTRDHDARYAAYEKVFAHLAEDLPWLPYYALLSGFAVAPELHDVTLFEESTLRVDLMWLDSDS